jgi:chemotaxis signal transduction protein
MSKTLFRPRRLSQTIENVDFLKLIVFEVTDYLFAFPLQVVTQVITCPPIVSTTQTGLGLVNLGPQSISVVDLEQELARQSTSFRSMPQRFLILTKTRAGETFGIPIRQPPVLMEVLRASIQSLPISYRQTNPLGIASHMVVLPETEGSLKIFVLGHQPLC